MKINVKRLNNGAIIPTRGSEYAAGYDLYSTAEYIISPGECAKIPTGIAMEIPNGFFGGVFARSGLATKQGLRPSNCVGVIDADYRGDITVAMYNDSEHTRVVKAGDRIAQIVIMPYLAAELTEADELDATDRGDGGFGSTDKYEQMSLFK